MIIDGKAVAQKIREELRTIVQTKKIQATLAFVLVGEHPPSETYVRMKIKGCTEVGIRSRVFRFAQIITEIELLEQIRKLNTDDEVDGMIIQEPLPMHIDPQKVHLAVNPSKDVDGFHPVNMGKLLMGDPTGFISCTPYGIVKLLEAYNIQTRGRHVVIIGRSNIVGKPMGALLLQKGMFADATLTIVHSKTEGIREYCLQADILIAALGSPHFVQADMIRENTVVIDVGMNRIHRNGKTFLVGDVDFEHVVQKCSYITPVPGGVGPMTIAMLLSNTVHSAIIRNNI